MNSQKISSRILSVILFVLVALPGLGLAQDVIVLKNGDRLRGEIKKISAGVLHFDTDYADTVFQIDWEMVDSVESDELFLIETTSGQRLTGDMKTDANDVANVVITEATGPVTVSRLDVVMVEGIDKGFWSRLGATADFGFSLAKANTNKQWSLGSGVNYLAEQWRTDFYANFLINSRTDAETTRNASIGGSYRRFLGEKWFAVGQGDFYSSTEQQIDLRSTIGGGMGAFVRRTQGMALAVSGGVNFTNEQFLDDTPASNGAEAFGGFEWDAFDVGDMNYYLKFVAFPSITDLGRVRLRFDSTIRWEIWDDFFWNVTFFDSYDSRPVIEDASKNDYGFTTGIGWSY